MLVLPDTSVWIDHLHKPDSHLFALLEEDEVVTHSAVVGELACGNISNRAELLHGLFQLRQITTVKSDECLKLIENENLWGRGLGWTDVHLIASCLIDGVFLWTRDKQLHTAATKLEVAYHE